MTGTNNETDLQGGPIKNVHFFDTVFWQPYNYAVFAEVLEITAENSKRQFF